MNSFLPWFSLLAAEGGASIDLVLVIGLVVLGLFLLGFFIFAFGYLNLWVQSILAGAEVGLLQMVAMRLRKVNPAIIVRAKVMAVQAKLPPIDARDLEAHALAGGNVLRVIAALISANRANLDLDYKTATGIDLAGRDVLEAVKTSVIPKVIDCPDPRKGKTEVAAVAKDGIQVLARARVTVRTNLSRLVGGAGEETVIARVGEGIVSAIGSSASHKEVLEHPDRISRMVLTRGLDSETAYQIVSIDIADVDIGVNIGARLQADQAEADKRVAQANAEKRRAMAVALEQENRAEVVLNRAKVILAEAQVPLALAEAFRSGNLGAWDYYRLRNVEADTKMRDTLGGNASGGGTSTSNADK